MFDWLLGGRSIDELIARKEYERAIQLANAELEKQPGDKSLRLKLSDALALGGHKPEAMDVLLALSDEYAQGGFIAKAIALLKRIQKIDPARTDAEDKLAALVSSSDSESMAQRLRRQQRQAASTPETAAPGPSAPPSPTRPAATPAPAPAEETVVPSHSATSGIARSPLFSDFSGAELLEVIRGLELQAFQQGEILVTEGEPGDSLFVLTEGTVRVYVKDSVGHNRPIRTMGDGTFFGEISILAGKPRTATITAATACELLELDRATLDAICEKQPRVRAVLEEFYEARIESSAEVEIRKAGGRP